MKDPLRKEEPFEKEDIITLIQKEVEGNPEATSIEISKKLRIPFTIVEMIRRNHKRSILIQSSTL